MLQRIRYGIFPTALLLSLGACTGTTDNKPSPPASAPLPEEPLARETSQSCDASSLSQFVGQEATQALGERILVLSGARTLRWGPPDSAWTMDYLEDRVNVRYDRAMLVTRVTCG